MRILYIGGTGTISYSCVLRDVALGRQVTVFNRGQRCEPLPAEVRTITADMWADQPAYAALGDEKFDVVCQFIAYDDTVIHRDADVFGGKCGQYVFISTASAYKKPAPLNVYTEHMPLENPNWEYSRKKIAMERQLLAWHAAGRLPVTIIRPSHTYRTRFPGTFLSGEETAWRMVNGRAVISHGDGTALWTITHADDFAQMFCGLLGDSRALGEDFHITGQWAYSWDQIFQAMADALQARLNVVHVPSDVLVRINPAWAGPLLGDKTYSTLFDNSKAAAIAGPMKQQVTLEAGMQQVAAVVKPLLGPLEIDEAKHAVLDRIAEAQLKLAV